MASQLPAVSSPSRRSHKAASTRSKDLTSQRSAGSEPSLKTHALPADDCVGPIASRIGHRHLQPAAQRNTGNASAPFWGVFAGQSTADSSSAMQLSSSASCSDSVQGETLSHGCIGTQMGHGLSINSSLTMEQQCTSPKQKSCGSLSHHLSMSRQRSMWAVQDNVASPKAALQLTGAPLQSTNSLAANSMRDGSAAMCSSSRQGLTARSSSDTLACQDSGGSASVSNVSSPQVALCSSIAAHDKSQVQRIGSLLRHSSSSSSERSHSRALQACSSLNLLQGRSRAANADASRSTASTRRQGLQHCLSVQGSSSSSRVLTLDTPARA